MRKLILLALTVIPAAAWAQAIPQNYLIDPDGKIIAKNLRGEELTKKLASIFN